MEVGSTHRVFKIIRMVRRWLSRRVRVKVCFCTGHGLYEPVRIDVDWVVLTTYSVASRRAYLQRKYKR